jgi:hypothetical protein
MRQIRNSHKTWLENLKGRDHLEDLGINGKILEWMLEEYVRRCGLDSSG